MSLRRIALFLAFSFLACPPSRAQVSSGDLSREIQGIVRSAATNQPIPGASVTLESDIGEVVQQISPEGSGGFTFPSLGRAIYYISASAPGFRKMRQRADLFTLRRVSVQLFLLPDKVESGSKPSQGPIDQRVLQIPEDAQKELAQGIKQLKAGKRKESVEHFRKVIALAPDFAPAYVFLGTVYMDFGLWGEAENVLQKAVSLNAKLAVAQLSLGAVLARKGNYAAAEQPLVRGLELNPETLDGQIELAKVYLAQGKWKDAEPPTRKALAIKSDAPVAHVLLGNILLRKNDPKGALNAFNTYLKLDPNGPFAPKARDTVAHLEKALAQAPEQP